MPLEYWVGHSVQDRFLYDWQTLIAGVLALFAAGGTIWATIRSANREIRASQAQTKVAQDQIATTLRLERRRTASEVYAFNTMLAAAMDRVITEAGEAREIFAKAPNFEEHDRQMPPPFNTSRTSEEARAAREHFTKSAFSELRGACLQHGGLLTAEFLELESLIDKFASCTVNMETLDLREQPTVVRVGYHEGLEDELAAIEAKARYLREEASKDMSVTYAILADAAEADAAINDPARETRLG